MVLHVTKHQTIATTSETDGPKQSPNVATNKIIIIIWWIYYPPTRLPTHGSAKDPTQSPTKSSTQLPTH